MCWIAIELVVWKSDPTGRRLPERRLSDGSPDRRSGTAVPEDGRGAHEEADGGVRGHRGRHQEEGSRLGVSDLIDVLDCN